MYIIRMADSGMPKRFMNYIPEGKRRVGRPKVRWINAVNNNMR
jgi:hypothetical protein